jgi:hypothetical protein
MPFAFAENAERNPAGRIIFGAQAEQLRKIKEYLRNGAFEDDVKQFVENIPWFGAWAQMDNAIDQCWNADARGEKCDWFALSMAGMRFVVEVPAPFLGRFVSRLAPLVAESRYGALVFAAGSRVRLWAGALADTIQEFTERQFQRVGRNGKLLAAELERVFGFLVEKLSLCSQRCQRQGNSIVSRLKDGFKLGIDKMADSYTKYLKRTGLNKVITKCATRIAFRYLAEQAIDAATGLATAWTLDFVASQFLGVPEDADTIQSRAIKIQDPGDRPVGCEEKLRNSVFNWDGLKQKDKRLYDGIPEDELDLLTPHHIVPVTETKRFDNVEVTINNVTKTENTGNYLRAMLEVAGLEVADNGCNGVLLPGTRSGMTKENKEKLRDGKFGEKYKTPVNHVPMHGKDVYMNIFRRIKAKFEERALNFDSLSDDGKRKYKDEMCTELQDIGKDLLEGGTVTAPGYFSSPNRIFSY